jgi:hypothetical protein
MAKFLVVRKDSGEVLGENDQAEEAVDMLRGFGVGCIVARAADGKVIAERVDARAGHLPWYGGGYATAISVHWGV